MKKLLAIAFIIALQGCDGPRYTYTQINRVKEFQNEIVLMGDIKTGESWILIGRMNDESEHDFYWVKVPFERNKQGG